jgi:hypothetical protein
MICKEVVEFANVYMVNHHVVIHVCGTWTVYMVDGSETRDHVRNTSIYSIGCLAPANGRVPSDESGLS